MSTGPVPVAKKADVFEAPALPPELAITASVGWDVQDVPSYASVAAVDAPPPGSSLPPITNAEVCVPAPFKEYLPDPKLPPVVQDEPS